MEEGREARRRERGAGDEEIQAKSTSSYTPLGLAHNCGSTGLDWKLDFKLGWFVWPELAADSTSDQARFKSRTASDVRHQHSMTPWGIEVSRLAGLPLNMN